MAKRVWVLHCLGFSFDCGVNAFQVSKNCRFTEVFMESVTEDVFVSSEGDPRVSFTVVPGFKVGKTAIQCQVYLSPASS
ncbi:hypothetical protein L1049_010061 [Liquidambar formosana]|uniref:GIL1/IRKI C-terminal domain-containing protein n=1 Tax=Liquidambar formosana TaxID=63359 RepID=A0AAP0R400_LIQFO